MGDARSPGAGADPLASALHAATWRLIPFMFLLYLVAYLDRVNVGFAQLQMKQALGLSDAVYGFGAGLFFVGYFLFELPSNLILERVGPRRWIARIMITWGLLSSATMFVQGERSFYTLRVLLGLAEAGFFPGMILYLTYWFPARERAAAVARFMTAISLSLVVGGPLSGAIMEGLHGVAGWQGWQWLFLLEGVPSIVLGGVVLVLLPDRPADVRWLDADEKAALAEALARSGPAREAHTLRDALVDGRVWLLSVIYFLFAMGLYGLTLWVPQIIKDVAGGSALRVGLLSAIPYLLAAGCMLAWGRFADRSGRPRLNLIAPTLTAALGLGSAALLLGEGALPTLCALSLGVMGLFSAFGPFWATASSFLRGTAAAGGIAVINSFGNLGGFASPWLVGVVKRQTGSFVGGIGAIAGALLLAALLVAVIARGRPAR
jgi:D-galactonate transporter